MNDSKPFGHEYAKVAWTAADIEEVLRQYHEDEQVLCNLERIDAWLASNADRIAEAMVRAGYDAIDACLNMTRPGDIVDMMERPA